MIQGGDPTGTGMGWRKYLRGQLRDEFSKELFNLRGALSMANAGPNTNGSQFLYCQQSKRTRRILAWSIRREVGYFLPK